MTGQRTGRVNALLDLNETEPCMTGRTRGDLFLVLTHT